MTDLSKIVEMLAKQATGNQSSSQGGGIANLLGSVLGQLNQNSQNQNNQNNTANNSGLGSLVSGVLGQLTGASSSSSSTSQTSAASSSTTQKLLLAVVPLILAWIQKQGGLQGALDKLRNAGFAQQVQSWMGAQSNAATPAVNENLPQAQVKQLFDDQDVEKVAEQTQAPKQDIYSAIATVLPQIISSLTPQGDKTNTQEANQDIQNVLNLVSGFLKK